MAEDGYNTISKRVLLAVEWTKSGITQVSYSGKLEYKGTELRFTADKLKGKGIGVQFIEDNAVVEVKHIESLSKLRHPWEWKAYLYHVAFLFPVFLGMAWLLTLQNGIRHFDDWVWLLSVTLVLTALVALMSALQGYLMDEWVHIYFKGPHQEMSEVFIQSTDAFIDTGWLYKELRKL